MPTQRKDAAFFMKQFEFARKERSKYERVWQQIANVIEPMIALIGEVYDDRGMRGDHKIFDSQPTKARDVLANALHASIFPPFSPFVAPTIGNRRLIEQFPGFRMWLAEVNEIIQEGYTQSNFQTEINPVMVNMVTWGHGILFHEGYPVGHKRYGEMKFKAIPHNEGYGLEDEDGRISSFFRKYELRAESILSKPLWVENLERAHPGSIKVMKDNPNERHYIIHHTSKKSEDDITVNKDHEYLSVYMLEDKSVILNYDEGRFEGFYENPIYMPRWRVQSSAIYAGSPALSTLGEAQAAQVVAKLRMKAIPGLITPALEVVKKNLYGSDVSLVPGALNNVRATGSINPITTSGRLDAAFFENDRLKENIRQAYHEDEFRFAPDLPQMTALEAQIRTAINQGLFGPFLSRTDYELSQPMNQRTFWLKWRAGEIPEPPVRFDPKQLRFALIGPLPMAQKIQEVQASREFVTEMMNLGQADPVFSAKINSADYVDWRAENQNTSFFHFIRSTDEAEQLVQQQQQMAAIPEAAAAGKDAASAAVNFKRAEEGG